MPEFIQTALMYLGPVGIAAVLAALIPEIESIPRLQRIMRVVSILGMNTRHAKSISQASTEELESEINSRRGYS